MADANSRRGRDSRGARRVQGSEDDRESEHCVSAPVPGHSPLHLRLVIDPGLRWQRHHLPLHTQVG